MANEASWSDPFSLTGRAAWITGASRGLGREIALRLAAAGAELLLTARDADALDEVVAEVRAGGGFAYALAGSVTDEASVAAAVRQADQRWGRLDILVNNAGISPSFERVEHLDIGTVTEILDVNLVGPFRCSTAAYELLTQSADASVVNISSIHGRAAMARTAGYAASKGGLEMFTKTLALDWARDQIRVNAVAPGYLVTDMTHDLRHSDNAAGRLLSNIPLRRFGTPNEVATAVQFLASAASSYMTGASLVVDGGWTAR
ncbi:SDR family NAD(P)-dependent oxidoreductase [Kribbella sp. CWNU-51]